MVRLQVLSGLLYGHGRGDQPYCIFYEDVVTLLSDNRIKDHTKEVLPGGERRSGFCAISSASGRHACMRGICRATDSERFDRELPAASRRSYRGMDFPYTTVRDTKTTCEGIRVPE